MWNVSWDDWVSACRNVVMAGVRCAGRGRKTWYGKVYYSFRQISSYCNVFSRATLSKKRYNNLRSR